MTGLGLAIHAPPVTAWQAFVDARHKASPDEVG
jgi:hypothetical protein